MYLPLKTILLLGTALVAAVPTTNDAPHDDASQPQEIDDLSGNPISLEGLTTLDTPRWSDMVKVASALEPKTHVIMHARADGRVFVNFIKADPAPECFRPKPPAELKSGDLVAEEEQRGCKWDCFKKYGPVFGRKCMRDCED
jgi:hypothetical protein